MNFSVTAEVLSETFFPMNASAVHSLPIPYNITPVRSLSTIIPMFPDTAFVRSHIGIIEKNMVTVVKNYGNITLGRVTRYAGIADNMDWDIWYRQDLRPCRRLPSERI